MLFSKLRIQQILLVLVVCLFCPILASAQAPSGMSISPSHIYRPGTYTLCVPNGAWMTLDIYYLFNDHAAPYIYGWPSLNGSGCADIYANENTALGTYTFTAAENAEDPGWVDVYAVITVELPPAYPQPTSMTFSPTSGYAGNQTCYVLTVGNGGGMNVDMQYRINGVPQPVTSLTMDGNGQWAYCPAHYDAAGQYDFTAIKNHSRSDWVTLSPWASYYLWPPKPTSLSISPASVTAGSGSYRMTVGNGALITLDTRFNLNGAGAVTMFGWPTLAAVSSGSPNGQADVSTSVCQPPAVYNFTQIENPANGVWVSVAASETVVSPGPPSITSVVPAGGSRGTNVDVVFSGTNLCGASGSPLSASWSGLTFSNVQLDPTSLHATFNISSAASLGNATVTLNAGGGSTNFAFTVLPPVGLTKEYIYLGSRVIATEAP